MTADSAPPGGDTGAVSDEALRKAEQFVEAEEGATNRLMGWAGTISTAIAVVMSLFHLYAAYAIVPTQELRYTHVAFTLVLSFLLFPVAARFPQPGALVGYRPRDRRCHNHRLRAVGRRRFPGPRHRSRPLGRDRRHRVHRAGARSDAAHHRADHALWLSLFFLAYAHARPASAGAVDPPRLRQLARMVGPLFITLEGIFGVAVDVSPIAHHPVHDLRRVPAAIRRRQVLHRFLALALMGGKPNGRGPHRGAVLVPARRPVGLRRRHHRDDRLRGRSDAGQGRLREERRRRIAGGRRPRRHSARRRCWAPPRS